MPGLDIGADEIVLEPVVLVFFCVFFWVRYFLCFRGTKQVSFSVGLLVALLIYTELIK